MPRMRSETVLHVFLRESQAVVQETHLEAKLARIAHAVVEAGLYRRAVVQLYDRVYGEKMFGCAGVTADEEEWLRTHDVLGPDAYGRIARYAVALGGPVYFIPHDRLPEVLPAADQFLLSGQTRWKGRGYWHPDDMLYCELTSSDGLAMGNLTADEPFDGRVPTPRTAALLAPFVALASTVLEQEVGRRRDALTGCFNGPACRDEMARRLASGRRFALVFLDMDNLKQINDGQGHAAGDRAIVETARALGEVLATVGGFAGRLHGDEFIALFWTDGDEVTVAEQLARTWRPRLLGVSWGVTVSEPGDDPDRLLRRAELAMYLDKAHRKRYPSTSAWSPADSH
jgi:diguanylate cyclase (GGDEF)-like protein